MPTSAGGKGAARAATQAQAFPLLWASVSAQTSRRPPFAERGPPRARGQPASGPRARLVKLHPQRHPVYARGDRLGGESATQ